MREGGPSGRVIIRPSRNPDEMRLFRPIVALLGVWLMLLLAVPAFAADVFAEAARRLALEIAAKAGNEMSISVRNMSSVSAGQFAAIRRTLESQLRAQGLKVVMGGAVETRITLAENVQGFLWVAEIRNGDTQQVAIEPIARDTTAASTPMFVLRRTLIWTQDEPILDLALLNSGGTSRLVVLGPGRVSLYAMQGARGELVETAPILRTAPLPRDVRGRLIPAQDHLFDAYLPGMHCTAEQKVAGTTCTATDDPWPLDLNLNAFFAASRDFFTGLLSGTAAQGKTIAPFYSAAKLDDHGSALWVFAGVDGRARIFDGATESVADLKGWGSDIAGMKSNCGTGTQLLASRAADTNSPDAVQAFELAGRQLVVASQPIEFAGPITALWPAEGGAVAVTRNLKTGSYEAFSLTVDCGR